MTPTRELWRLSRDEQAAPDDAYGPEYVIHRIQEEFVMLDALFDWMAVHPWRVGIIITATILFVGRLEIIPGVIAQ